MGGIKVVQFVAVVGLIVFNLGPQASAQMNSASGPSSRKLSIAQQWDQFRQSDSQKFESGLKDKGLICPMCSQTFRRKETCDKHIANCVPVMSDSDTDLPMESSDNQVTNPAGMISHAAFLLSIPLPTFQPVKPANALQFQSPLLNLSQTYAQIQVNQQVEMEQLRKQIQEDQLKRQACTAQLEQQERAEQSNQQGRSQKQRVIQNHNSGCSGAVSSLDGVLYDFREFAPRIGLPFHIRHQ